MDLKDVSFREALIKKWAYTPETISRFSQPRNGYIVTARPKIAAGATWAPGARSLPGARIHRPRAEIITRGSRLRHVS